MLPFLELRYIFRIIHILKQPILNPMLRVIGIRGLCLGRERWVGGKRWWSISASSWKSKKSKIGIEDLQGKAQLSHPALCHRTPCHLPHFLPLYSLPISGRWKWKPHLLKPCLHRGEMICRLEEPEVLGIISFLSNLSPFSVKEMTATELITRPQKHTTKPLLQ